MFWDEGNSHGVQETTLKNLSQTFHKCRNYNLATLKIPANKIVTNVFVRNWASL